MLKRSKLNSKGFSHHFLMAFIVLAVAIGGTYYLVASHANVPAMSDTAELTRNEATVRRGFWEKARRTLGRVPFTEDAVAAFYCATDSATPLAIRATLLGALAYFVLPESHAPSAGRIDFSALNPLRPLRWAFSMKSLLPVILIFFLFSATGEAYGVCWALWGGDAFGWQALDEQRLASYLMLKSLISMQQY